MAKQKSEELERLVRIETRLNNFIRWSGGDVRRRPPPNEPDQSVFIAGGAVYVTPNCTIGDMLVAVRRTHWPDELDEVPIILNGRELGVVNVKPGTDIDDSPT